MSKKHEAIVVPHTHWDREWRYPIWTSRTHLKAFFDALLAYVDEDDFTGCFLLDGQTVMVMDHLELFPEDEAAVRQAVSAGKVVVGPWYTLPDLFPVSGESLVRNLLKGRKISLQFGKENSIAFTTFGWGQSAQMPQIYAGFGMKAIITAKYLAPDRCPDIEFLWQAPDGTRMLCSRLGKDARGSFFFNTYIPARFGCSYTSPDYRYRWGTGQIIRSAACSRQDEDYQRNEEVGTIYPDVLQDAFAVSWDAFGATTVPECRLMLDGSDATFPQKELSRMLHLINKMQDSIQIRLGTLEEYMSYIRKAVKVEELQTICGELRDGPATSCTCNALATRIPIKQKNKAVENLVMTYAEPLMTLCALVDPGYRYPYEFMERCWDYLLKAQPHDSINGVTQDKSVRDVLYRLEQAEEIARTLLDTAIGSIISHVSVPKTDGKTFVLIYNPLTRAVSPIIEGILDLPDELHSRTVGLKEPDSIACCRSQCFDRRSVIAAVNDHDARPWPVRVNRHSGFFEVGAIPPAGWKILEVVPNAIVDETHIWPTMRTNRMGLIGQAPGTLRNSYLSVKADQGGSVTITDLQTGEEYVQVLHIVDEGDVGDYWVHYSPYGGSMTSSAGVNSAVRIIRNGELQADMEIRYELEVPSHCEHAGTGLTSEGRQVDQSAKIQIAHLVSLRKDEPYLRVKTTIRNTAEDHRMRLLLPIGADVETVMTDSHFYVDSREAGYRMIPGSEHEYWPEMQTYPCGSCVDFVGPSRSLAIFSRSFTEYEVLHGETDTAAMTLFRAVQNKICTESRSYSWYHDQKGGQLLDLLQYDYAIYPHKGLSSNSQLYALADTYLNPPLMYQFTQSCYGSEATVNFDSLVSIDSDSCRISCIKPSEDREGVIIRIWNIEQAPIAVQLETAFKVGTVFAVDLSEKIVEELHPDTAYRLPVDLGPCEIKTLKVVFEKE